jgi:hypothetical protein
MATTETTYIKKDVGRANSKARWQSIGNIGRKIIAGRQSNKPRFYGQKMAMPRSENRGRFITNYGIRRTGYQGKKGYAGRGRPRGSYKYTDVYGRPISVFEWRRLQTRLRQQQSGQPMQYPSQPQSYGPQALGYPQQPNGPVFNQGEMQGTYIKPPEYDPNPAEMKVFHSDNPLGLDSGKINAPDQYYLEPDLFGGPPKLKLKGSLF